VTALVLAFRPRSSSSNGEGPGPAEKRRRRALWRYDAVDEQPGKTKRCAGCKFYKPLSAFYVSRKAPDGRQSRCIACETERAKTRNREWQSPHVEPHRVSGGAPIANDVERGTEPEPDESDYEEGKLASVVARSVNAYDRATRGDRGVQFRSTPWWIEDDLPIERWVNEVLAELCAGKSLRVALQLANRDLPEDFAEDRPVRGPDKTSEVRAARAGDERLKSGGTARCRRHDEPGPTLDGGMEPLETRSGQPLQPSATLSSAEALGEPTSIRNADRGGGDRAQAMPAGDPGDGKGAQDASAPDANSSLGDSSASPSWGATSTTHPTQMVRAETARRDGLPHETKGRVGCEGSDSDSGASGAPLAPGSQPPSAARPARPRAPKADRSPPSSRPPRGPERACDRPPSARGMTRTPHPDLPEISMSDDALDERLLALLQKGPIARRDAVADLKVPVAQLHRVYRRLWDAGKAHARGMARAAVWVAGPATTGAVGKKSKTIAQIAKKLPKPRRRITLAPQVPIPSQDLTVVSLREKAEALEKKAARFRSLADELEELES